MTTPLSAVAEPRASMPTFWTAREARNRGPPDLSVYSRGAIAVRISVLIFWMHLSEEISVSLSAE